MTKIKIQNKELNKLETAVNEISTQLESYQTQRDSITKEMQELQNNINECNALIMDYASGNIPMDVNKYITTKHQLVLLEEQKGIKVNALKDLERDFEGLESILIENMFNAHKDEVVREYADNRYNIINEMFIKMMEVCELSEQLEKESKKYYSMLQATGHPKAGNYRFETGLSMMWKRFVMNGFGIKYSTAITSKVQEFEEKYYKGAEYIN